MKMTPIKFVAFFVLGFAATWALDHFEIIDLGRSDTATEPSKMIVLRPSIGI